jgi:catechol 2,3-dioxygenase-like lactoylglutathione lyase family enzyme
MTPEPKEAGLGAFALVAFAFTSDPTKAREFYGGTLGLRFISQDSYAVVFEAHGNMLRVGIVPEVKPARHTILGWEVPDIAAAVRTLVAAGVQFERYEGMGQDELGIWTPPNGDKVAWFKDPDGNVLSLSQHAPIA